MCKFTICLLVLGTLTKQANSLTILERHLEKQGNPKLRLAEHKAPNVHDWVFQHDLEQKLNYKSIFHVGTFRGLPIKSRQNSVYVDGSGEVHSILPYNKMKREPRGNIAFPTKLRKWSSNSCECNNYPSGSGIARR